MRIANFLLFLSCLVSFQDAYACLNNIDEARANAFIERNFSHKDIVQFIATVETYNDYRKRQYSAGQLNELKLVTSENFFEELDKEFNHYMKCLPDTAEYKTEFKVFYAVFLWSHNKSLDAINTLSQSINSTFTLHTDFQTTTLLNFLRNVKFELAYPKGEREVPAGEVTLKLYLKDLNAFWRNPKQYAISKNLINKSNSDVFTITETTKKKISNSILESSDKLMDLLQKLPTCDCYDAMLQILVAGFNVHGYEETAEKFVRKEYLKHKATASDMLKVRYAVDCLRLENKFEQASQLLESVLGITRDPNNPYQRHENYMWLGLCLCYYEIGAQRWIKSSESVTYRIQDPKRIEVLNKALTALKTASSIEDTMILSVYKMSSNFHTLLGEYEQAYEMLKPVINAGKETLEDADIDIKAAYSQYALILQKTGRTEELSQHLKQRLLKTRIHNVTIADLIRFKQENDQKEKEAAQRAEQERQEKQAQHRQASSSSSSSSTQIIEDTPFLCDSAEQKRQERREQRRRAGNSLSSSSAQVIQDTSCICESNNNSTDKVPPKAKKKTRGNPSEEQPVSQAQPAPPKPLIFIEDIITNKQAIKTFYLFFEKYRSDVKSDNNVKISLHQTCYLFDALDQDFDPSKGHGSHTKVTTNFQKFGSDAAVQVATLGHHTQLILDQIIDIRDLFLNARIVPKDNDIIESLKKEGAIKD